MPLKDPKGVALHIVQKEFHMKDVIKRLGIIAFVAVIGFSMAACGDGSGGGDGGGGNGGGGGGGLKGTSWSRSASLSRTYGYSFTYTIKFTSATNMQYNQKGWGMVNGKKNNYDDTTNGTYTYYPEIKEGWINCSALTNPYTFYIDGNQMKSKVVSTVWKKD